MIDYEEKLKSYLLYQSTYWYNKMKAFEHMQKEAAEKWEECFQENNIVHEMKYILRDKDLMNSIITYQSYAVFYNHTHKSFEYKDKCYPEDYDAHYKGFRVKAIESIYNWLETYGK